MKTHLNTLFVSTEGTYLAKEGEAVVVKQGEARPLRVPVHMLESIVCFGAIKVSPYLMELCSKRGVSVTFLGHHGRFLARVQGPVSGNVVLRREQFRTSEDPAKALSYARVFVQAKIFNSRVVLGRASRDHGDPGGVLADTGARLKACIARAETAGTADQLRGIEGEAARHYFSAFPRLVRGSGDGLAMNGRSRRPPRDPVNALLSFTYALLAADLRSACETVGLDPQVGFLHSDRPGRAGLALDLMEELRPVIADRVSLSLLNRQQVTPDDFVTEIGGAVRMSEEARKTVLVQYQTRKKEELRHPFLGEKVSLGMVALLQTRLLARTLRGELDAYPAFLWR